MGDTAKKVGIGILIGFALTFAFRSVPKEIMSHSISEVEKIVEVEVIKEVRVETTRASENGKKTVRTKEIRKPSGEVIILRKEEEAVLKETANQSVASHENNTTVYEERERKEELRISEPTQESRYAIGVGMTLIPERRYHIEGSIRLGRSPFWLQSAIGIGIAFDKPSVEIGGRFEW